MLQSEMVSLRLSFKEGKELTNDRYECISIFIKSDCPADATGLEQFIDCHFGCMI